jgi:hypothetical protein
MPPSVQSLDQLMALTNSIYNPQRQQLTQQIGAAGQAGQAEEQGLYATQNQAFKNIAQMASNKGMLFSGFSPDQQAQYNATKFMPAMAGLRSKVQDNIARLQSAMLGLDTDQRKGAMATQQSQQDRLYSWNQEQDRRKWEKEQSEIAYQRELQKLKQQQAFQASQRASSAPGKPGTDIVNYFKDQLSKAGPLSKNNANASRQKQDQWVYQWFLDNGILDPGAQTQVWNLVNSTFNRNNDPTKDWLYRR